MAGFHLMPFLDQRSINAVIPASVGIQSNHFKTLALLDLIEKSPLVSGLIENRPSGRLN